MLKKLSNLKTLLNLIEKVFVIVFLLNLMLIYVYHEARIDILENHIAKEKQVDLEFCILKQNTLTGLRTAMF